MKRILFLVLTISILIVGCAKANDPTETEENSVLTEVTRVSLNGFGVGLDVGDEYIAVAEDNAGISLIDKETYERYWYTQMYTPSDGSVTNLGRNRRIHLLEDQDMLFFTEELGADNIRVASIENPDTLVFKSSVTGGTFAIKQIQIDPYVDPNSTEYINYIARGFYCNANTINILGWDSISWSLHGASSIKQYIFPTDVNGADMNDEVVAAACGQRGVFISDTESDDILAEINTPDEAYAVKIAGDYLYVADNRSGFRAYNISDLSNVQELFTYNTTGYARTISSDDNYAVVSSTSGGIYLFDISDPENISYVEKVDPGYCNKVQVNDGKIYVITKEGELIVYEY